MGSLLRRISTDYVAIEDRIRLTGELDDGEIVVLWLTQRQLGQLLHRLLPLLKPPAATGAASQAAAPTVAAHLQALAQTAARLEVPPVPAVPAGQATSGWLVSEVDLRVKQKLLALVLRGSAGEQATLELNPLLLRQWLSMLYHCCRRAGWPMAMWPGWIRADDSYQKASRAITLH